MAQSAAQAGNSQWEGTGLCRAGRRYGERRRAGAGDARGTEAAARTRSETAGAQGDVPPNPLTAVIVAM